MNTLTYTCVIRTDKQAKILFGEFFWHAAAGHQGVIEMFQLHIWGAFMLSIFVQSLTVFEIIHSFTYWLFPI